MCKTDIINDIISKANGPTGLKATIEDEANGRSAKVFWRKPGAPAGQNTHIVYSGRTSRAAETVFFASFEQACGYAALG